MGSATQEALDSRAIELAARALDLAERTDGRQESHERECRDERIRAQEQRDRIRSENKENIEAVKKDLKEDFEQKHYVNVASLKEVSMGVKDLHRLLFGGLCSMVALLLAVLGFFLVPYFQGHGMP